MVNLRSLPNSTALQDLHQKASNLIKIHSKPQQKNQSITHIARFKPESKRNKKIAVLLSEYIQHHQKLERNGDQRNPRSR